VWINAKPGKVPVHGEGISEKLMRQENGRASPAITVPIQARDYCAWTLY
jgi:hypothetical protein